MHEKPPGGAGSPLAKAGKHVFDKLLAERKRLMQFAPLARDLSLRRPCSNGRLAQAFS
jgi:hypothetical protein